MNILIIIILLINSVSEYDNNDTQELQRDKEAYNQELKTKAIRDAINEYHD